MENKKLNETYERPLVEVIDICTEESVCLITASMGGEDLNPGQGGI